MPYISSELVAAFKAIANQEDFTLLQKLLSSDNFKLEDIGENFPFQKYLTLIKEGQTFLKVFHVDNHVGSFLELAASHENPIWISELLDTIIYRLETPKEPSKAHSIILPNEFQLSSNKLFISLHQTTGVKFLEAIAQHHNEDVNRKLITIFNHILASSLGSKEALDLLQDFIKGIPACLQQNKSLPVKDRNDFLLYYENIIIFARLHRYLEQLCKKLSSPSLASLINFTDKLHDSWETSHQSLKSAWTARLFLFTSEYYDYCEQLQDLPEKDKDNFLPFYQELLHLRCFRRISLEKDIVCYTLLSMFDPENHNHNVMLQEAYKKKFETMSGDTQLVTEFSNAINDHWHEILSDAIISATQLSDKTVIQALVSKMNLGIFSFCCKSINEKQSEGELDYSLSCLFKYVDSDKLEAEKGTPKAALLLFILTGMKSRGKINIEEIPENVRTALNFNLPSDDSAKTASASYP